MTYNQETDFVSSTSTDSSPATDQKLEILQREGKERSQRIFKILRTAFSETVAEVKDGRTIMSPIAKEVTAETVGTVKEKSQEVANTVNQTWQRSVETEDIMERIVKFIRDIAQIAQEKLFLRVEKQARKQAVRLDNMLENRYGDRYANIKDNFSVIRTWHVASEHPVDTSNLDITESSMVIEVESEPV